MIFDLKSGKRRRVVQVVFGFLALIFFIGFVGFNIGGEGGGGGIVDEIVGGGESGSTTYDQQIEDAETTLETDPENQTALLDLVRYHYLSATESGVTTDPATGVTEVTETSRVDLEQSAQRWQEYLDTRPKEPDVGAAANAAQAYVLLGDAGGAASAQEIVAESQGTAAAYGQLAYYVYADGRIGAGDSAARKSVKAAEPSQRKQIEQNLDQLRKRAVKQQQLIKEQQRQQGGEDADSAQLEDPFGSLGGTAAP